MRAVAAGERSLELECGEGGVGSGKLIGTRTLSTFQGRHKQEQQYNTELRREPCRALPCERAPCSQHDRSYLFCLL